MLHHQSRYAQPILEKTPYELMKGRSPNLAHFCVFGCTCFIHNNGKDSLGKFDARADEGTFLGYSSRSKAYKVLNHRTGKVEESIHVKFDETLSAVPQVTHDEGEAFKFLIDLSRARLIHRLNLLYL